MEKTARNYAEIVENAFRAKNLSFGAKKDTDDGAIIFSLPMSADNAPGINLKLRVSEKGDSKFWCYLASNVPSRKRPAMIYALNKLNGRYRYICLSLDKDGDVHASYDFALFGDEEIVGNHVIAMLFLVADVMDHCIPAIWKVMWLTDKDEDDHTEPKGEEGGDNITMNPFD